MVEDKDKATDRAMRSVAADLAVKAEGGRDYEDGEIICNPVKLVAAATAIYKFIKGEV
jgi:hypothetical protein